MKILWVCNVIPSYVSKCIGLEGNSGGGWIECLGEAMDGNPEIEFALCANYQQSAADIYKAFWGNGSIFYGFRKARIQNHEYDDTLEGLFRQIIQEFSPDILHIFGTEYAHALAAVKAFGNPQRTVLHVQGIISIIARHYTGMLPPGVVNGWTFRDLIRHDNIRNQQKKFYARGEFEKETFKRAGFITGRTEWDRACSGELNPDAVYTHIQEMLRPSFYEGKWRYANCKKYRIFMSQGGYPVKGLHVMLEALAALKKRFPAVRLYVAGSDMKAAANLAGKIRRSSYTKYILQLIRRWELDEYVQFTGTLSTEAMKEQYLSANVFVSASLIENSSNSIGEAMLLGTPVVASDVGGVPSLLTHQQEGYLYPADEPYMLQHYISKIFEAGNGAEEMSERARLRAGRQYDREIITDATVSIYKSIMS